MIPLWHALATRHGLLVDERSVCGILGIARCTGNHVTISDAEAARLRDLMSHRGPDGSGLLRRGNVLLGHRRLRVVDTSDAASQPMETRGAALVYNGELYNDAEIRRELQQEGCPHVFRTHSDTETVLAALTWWSEGALGKFRGMFALGFVNFSTQQLILARDPLGIKPLVYHIRTLAGDSDAREIIFASEPSPILAHPDVSARPNMRALSAYLTTIRTSIGNQTLFEGINTLRPGEVLSLDLSSPALAPLAHARRVGIHSPAHDRVPPGSERDGQIVSMVRSVVADSVVRHWRSDVPACLLLSGGLDSSIIASCSALDWRDETPLRTYCSGPDANCDESDYAYAARMASSIGAVHHDAPVSSELFTQRWMEMIAAQGVPLSTPNEVAINHVARALRRDGHVVVLSGEGADELFGGYDEPMRLAHVFEQVRRWQPTAKSALADPGLHQLHTAAWIPIESKSTLLNPAVWHSLDDDEPLSSYYRDEFASIVSELPSDDRGYAVEPLEPHLRFLRAVNLTGLLCRLDSATMLASVEGRTPFADRVVAATAESLPMRWKYDPTQVASESAAVESGARTIAPPIAHTKRVLRSAFADSIPAAILNRSKASFSLPFQAWMTDAAEHVGSSHLVREWFTPAAIRLVTGNPAEHWRVAWPMFNLAIWGRRWWG